MSTLIAFVKRSTHLLGNVCGLGQFYDAVTESIDEPDKRSESRIIYTNNSIQLGIIFFLYSAREHFKNNSHNKTTAKMCLVQDSR